MKAYPQITDCKCGSDDQIICGAYIFNWIECLKCGRKSKKCESLDEAIADWNERMKGGEKDA